jgi:putative ABC transport system permease protein
VSAVVVVQALTIVVIALVVGVVLGVIGGRWAWALFADNIGIEMSPVVPWSGIAVLVPVALLLAVVVAVVPALLAARTHPADTLHTQ